ncbi:M1 family aminopeptidase [Flammeovirga agarivorans]|uniref:Aminopeptidase N n=1 Tax=Flammeovirga agarivorans TaxID=2726742 RepID=A0A7X8SMF0_9BACT|nr:M1 family aminopeptidase [Flammeovirga agarivorans]NLR92858.1 M1 family peptidase [Flammeovirga agarivorans]
MIFNYKHAVISAILLGSTMQACKTTQPAANGQSDIGQAQIDETILIEDTTTQENVDQTPEWVAKKGPYHAAYDQAFKILHTQLKVSFNWEKQHMNGDAVITLQPYFYPQSDIILDAKHFDIHKIELVDKQNKSITALEYTYDSLQLNIALDKEYSSDETCHLHIVYTAKPNERQSHGSEAITDDKGLYFINPLGDEIGKPQQIWTQGETQANSCWFPTFDHPNVKMKQDIFMTVQDKYVTLSNGKLVSQQKNSDGTRTDHWKQELPHSVYLAMMAVGDFAVVKDEWRGKEVSYYVEPAYEKYARTIFGSTPEMMEYFSNRFDYPFPWAKYSQIIIRDFVSGAMENTTASTFMESVQVDDREKLDQDWDFIVAHELFHHWFGDLVTTESWANLPLNESWANYSEYLWREYKNGKDEADFALQSELESYLYESETKQEPLIRYHYINREDMFDSHSYAKGGYILNLFRNTIGDDAFFKGASIYLKSNEFKAAEIANLRLAFEEVTGQDLNWFFNQWFMSAGHPDFYIKDSYVDGKVKLLVQQQQDPEYTPIYRIPTKVKFWWNDGKSEERKMTITKASETFQFMFDQQPDLVIFDPDHIIPGVFDHSKSPQAYTLQAKYAENVMHRVEAIEKLGESIVADTSVIPTLLTFMDDKFWGIRETTVAVFDQYQGTGDISEVVKKMRTMVLKDDNASVRATALSVLSSIDEQFIETAKIAMNDSSYAVVATALYASSSIEGPSILPKAEQFEDAKNPNIVFVLSLIYTDLAVEGKLDWFDKKLTEMNDQFRQYMFRSMTGYILTLKTDEDKEKAADIILKYATNKGSSTNTKIAAYQAVSPLLDNEAIKNRVTEAINAEKNDDVKQMLSEQGY